MNLRTSLTPLVILLTGSLVGLILAGDYSFGRMIWIILGIYFDLLFIYNIIRINKIIDNNIGAIKNEYKWILFQRFLLYFSWSQEHILTINSTESEKKNRPKRLSQLVRDIAEVQYYLKSIRQYGHKSVKCEK